MLTDTYHVWIYFIKINYGHQIFFTPCLTLLHEPNRLFIYSFRDKYNDGYVFIY
jgi:hypothetical protein